MLPFDKPILHCLYLQPRVPQIVSDMANQEEGDKGSPTELAVLRYASRSLVRWSWPTEVLHFLIIYQLHLVLIYL